MKKNNSTASKWDISYSSLDQSKHKNIPNPIGYSSFNSNTSKSSSKSKPKEIVPPNIELKNKKAWEIALGNAKNIPMNAIMLYMSGNGIQIFSIVITFMLLFNPIKDVMNVNTVFNRLKGAQHLEASFAAQKLVYILINLAIMGMGLWKCSSMGLLPTSPSDWLAFEPPRKFREIMLT